MPKLLWSVVAKISGVFAHVPKLLSPWQCYKFTVLPTVADDLVGHATIINPCTNYPPRKY